MLLLLVAHCLRSLTSKQQEIKQMPDKCQSKFDMSDMSCHFTPFSCPMSKLAQQRKDRGLNTWQSQSKTGSSGVSFQGTTSCCTRYEEFALHKKTTK